MILFANINKKNELRWCGGDIYEKTRGRNLENQQKERERKKLKRAAFVRRTAL